MPYGGAASGITAGLTQGLQLLRSQEQQRHYEAQQHAQRLNLYMRAVDTVTKHPETLSAIQGVLQPYGMDLDPSILGNVEETRKAHGAIGDFLTSGDFEAFSERAKTLPGMGALVAKSPSLTKVVETALSRAETARAIKFVDQGAREEGLTPGKAGWNDLLRRKAIENPSVAALLKGNTHLMGPESTAYGAQDPRLQGELSAARAFGTMRGHELARTTPYDELTGPQGITAFAPPPGTPMPGPAGPSELSWAPEDFSLRSGPAMAMLGGQMDPVPAPRGPLAVLPPAPGVPVRGAPARKTLADVEQERAAALTGARADATAQSKRENADPNAPGPGTWTIVDTADGPMQMNSRTGEFRKPSIAVKPKEAAGGTWVKEYAADGTAVLRNTKTNEIRKPDEPLAPKPTPAEKPKKYAELRDVVSGAAEMPPPPKPPSPADAKDADKIARVRAQLMTDYQAKLNASVGHAGVAANSALRKAGWDPEAIRAAQGKTSQYLQQAPTTTAGPSPGRGASPESPSIEATAPDQGVQSPQRALRPPAGATPAAAQAEYNRLRKAGHTPESAKSAMKQLGW